MKQIETKKRIIAYISILCAAIILMPVVVSADNTASATLVSIGDLDCPANGTVTVPIMLYNIQDYGTGKINVTYNPAVVHVTGIAGSSDSTLVTHNENNTAGIARITAWNTAGVSGDIVFANITFTVVGTGSTLLNLDVDKLADTSMKSIPLTISNGSIGIESMEPSTSFLVQGYVYYENGSEYNDPTVNLTNLNTSREWIAETIESSNYYEIMLASSTDIIAGETLQFNAISPDGSQSVTTEHTVTQDEINYGGISNYNITLVVTSDRTDPVINSVTLDPTDPTTGDNITVTVNATDDVGVTAVTADGVSLINDGGDDIWEGTITAIEGTHTVNISASDAAVNTINDESASYTTSPSADTTDPVINSVTLDPTDPTTGDNITVTVNATDDVKVTAVTADGVSLINDGGDDIWEGTITAIEGTHTVNISASDAAANTVYDVTANYTASPSADITPPVISNVTNTDPTTDSVTISWDTDEDSNSVVKYGTTSGNYTELEYDATLVSLHSISLTGLNATTTYYYLVNSTDTSDNAGESSESSFTTTDTSDITPPVISNVENTGPTTDSVTISWNTDEDSDSVVRYGTTSGNYTELEYDATLVSLHSISLTGLNATTTYYYVVNSTDASGNAGEGSESSFTTTDTSDITPPVISNVENTGPTTDSVTISWNTDEDSDSVVRYGTTSSNYTELEYDATLVSLHSISLTGLSAETTYYYVVNSTDASGNAGEGSESSFTTQATSDITTIRIGNAIAAPNGYAFASIIVDNVTNLGSGNIIVTYNSSVVHVTNVTSGDGNALVIQDWNADNTAGSVTIAAWDADESHNGDVVFANVTFHAAGEYPDSTPLDISSSELIDYTSYGIIEHSVTSGTFSIIDDEPPMIMDTNATPGVIVNENERPRIPGTNVTVLNATVLDVGSGVANVTIDLSSIGGSGDQVMERIAGTDVWTVATTANDGINLTHELVVTATDVANNTNTSVIGLTVLLRGDVVRDGDVNSADALYIAKYLVGKEPMPSLLVSDMSPAEGDGRVTSADALYLAKYLVGKEVAP